MRTKFIRVTDSGTLMHFLVIELEEVDRHFLDDAGIQAGMRIVLNLRNWGVSCIATRDAPFSPSRFAEWKEAPFPQDATSRTLLKLLQSFDSIKKLPDELNVAEASTLHALLFQRSFISSELRNLLNERSRIDLRKAAYRFGRMYHMAIVDMTEEEVVFDCGSSSFESLKAEFLWIPVSTLTPEEASRVRLSPFRYEILLPEMK